MTVNQQTLAEELSISQVTVSRALRNEPGVRPAVRAAVLAAAARLGYQPRGGREAASPRATGVLCADLVQGDRFTERILAGICAAAATAGKEVLASAHALGDLPLVVKRRQVDGLLRLLSDQDFSRAGVAASPVPAVSILYRVPEIDSVSVDHYASARELGVCLAQLGHRRAAYVGIRSPISEARMSGFRAALEAAGGGVSDALIAGGLQAETVAPVVDELLRRWSARPQAERPTVVACYNDYQAGGVLSRLREHGVRVPEDLSVVGYDGVAPPSLTDAELTTVALPLEDLGAEAVRRVLWRLEETGGPPVCCLLRTEVVVGRTTAPPSPA